MVTEAIETIRKEPQSVPVRALVILIVVLMLTPTLECHYALVSVLFKSEGGWTVSPLLSRANRP
jgi:hypothetical protein